MYSCTIINRAGAQRTWYAYNGTDSWIPKWDDADNINWKVTPGHHGPPWGWTARYWDSRSIDPNEQQDIQLKESQSNFYIRWTDTVGPFLRSSEHHLVITPNEDDLLVLVDLDDQLTILNHKLRGEAYAPSRILTDDAAMRQVMLVVSGLFNGLAAALSAGGTPFAVAVGMSTTMASLIGSGMSTADGPPPAASIGVITQALLDVLQQQGARDSALNLIANYEWFTDYTRQIADFRKRGQDAPNTLMQIFDQGRRTALSPDGSSLFVALTTISRQPSLARYIVPELLLGVALYLHLKRIEIAEIYLPGAALDRKQLVPSSVMENLTRQATNFRDLIAIARDEFVKLRRDYVKASGLEGTPEAIFILKAVSKVYAGDPYAVRDKEYASLFPNGSSYIQGGEGYGAAPDLVATAFENLDTIITHLNEDLTATRSGRWPQNLLNVKWSTSGTSLPHSDLPLAPPGLEIR